MFALVTDKGLRIAMERKEGELVRREFAESIVVHKTIDLYCSMLDERWPEST